MDNLATLAWSERVRRIVKNEGPPGALGVWADEIGALEEQMRLIASARPFSEDHAERVLRVHRLVKRALSQLPPESNLAARYVALDALARQLITEPPPTDDNPLEGT